MPASLEQALALATERRKLNCSYVQEAKLLLLKYKRRLDWIYFSIEK